MFLRLMALSLRLMGLRLSLRHNVARSVQALLVSGCLSLMHNVLLLGGFRDKVVAGGRFEVVATQVLLGLLLAIIGHDLDHVLCIGLICLLEFAFGPQ